MRAANSLASQPARDAVQPYLAREPGRSLNPQGSSRVGNAAEAGAAADDWSGRAGLWPADGS